MKPQLVAACGLAALAPAYAARFPLKGRPRSTQEHDILRRAQQALFDISDFAYFVELSVAGHDFSALVDTGSSDFWVQARDADLPTAIDAGFNTVIHLVSTDIEGSVKIADLSLAGLTARSQMFMRVEPGGDGIHALLGLGPQTSSFILAAAPDKSKAIPPLYHIFKQNPTILPYITVLLGRTIDSDDPYPGYMTIGEILIVHNQIEDQPRLPVSKTSNFWRTIIDANGVIGPNGPILYSSVVNGGAGGVVIVDTGFTFTQVPPQIATAIYGPSARVVDAPGNAGKFYAVPCSTLIDLSFKIGGTEFPIHPLDVVVDPGVFRSRFSPPLESDMCLGGFQPIFIDNTGQARPTDSTRTRAITRTQTSSSTTRTQTSSSATRTQPSPSPTETPRHMFDMVLGMTFLRNAYTLFNYGSNSELDDAYIQMLPLTNKRVAIYEFRIMRGTV